MRLSGWRKTAPTKESTGDDVIAMLKPVLVDLGADSDPTCWVVWGDDPQLRYSVLVPTLAGLILASVRTSGPEGVPRATAKLTRWTKLTVSDLTLESSGGHRIVAVQVESLVLKGVDDEADRICEFIRGLMAEIDDRHPQRPPVAIVQAAAAGGVLEAPAGRAARPAATAAAASKTAPKAVRKPAAKTIRQAAAAPKVARKRAAVEPDPADVAADAFAAAPVTRPAAVAALGPGPSVPAATAAADATVEAEPHPAHGQTAPAKDKPAPRAARPAEAAAAGPLPGPAAEPPEEVGRSNWIPPHPIVVAAHKPPKSRPWRP
jgi:hypothetical protein